MVRERLASPVTFGGSQPRSSSDRQQQEPVKQASPDHPPKRSRRREPSVAPSDPDSSNPSSSDDEEGKGRGSLPTSKPNDNDPTSGDDEEDSDDSDSSSEPSAKSDKREPEPPETVVAAPALQPPYIVSVPSDSTPPRRSLRLKCQSRTPAASAPGLEKGKRKAPGAAEEEVAGEKQTSSAKKPFQRVWTEEDEIALLERMVEFRAQHGVADMPAAAKFIVKSVHREFSKVQVYEKIRRLKQKYKANLGRQRNGANPPFAKPHEKATFELSKQVWATPAGPGADAAAAAASTFPNLKEAVSLLESDGGEGLLSASSLRQALALLPPAKSQALDERWSRHFAAGMTYVCERSQLKTDLLLALSAALEDA